MIAFLSGSVLAYDNSYLVVDPVYLCQNTPGGEYESCTKEEACELGSWKIDWESVDTLDNWITQNNWNCKYFLTHIS